MAAALAIRHHVPLFTREGCSELKRKTRYSTEVRRMPGDDAIISLSAAARLWRVSRATVYEWRAGGRLPFFHSGRRGLEAALRDVRNAKVLTEPALQALVQPRIPTEVVNLAVQNAIVVPEDARFSLNDLEALKRFAAIGPLDADVPPPSPRRISGLQLSAFRWTVEHERAWALAGADPAALPDPYWATPVPPRFIPPIGVFFYSFGKRVRNQQLMHRSAGYEKRADDIVWRWATEDYYEHKRLRIGDSMPRSWSESSQRYLVAAEQWMREWHRRRHRGRTG
jgi:hypothetical protein